MGRKRVQLKKIERDDYRQICFGKRKDGLVKKAYELSTLCDVEVALIIFSAAGKLIIFDGKRRVEETIRRYIDLPYHEFGRVPNEETIRGLINQMSMETKVYHQLNSSSDRNRRMVDTQLEIIQNQISLANVRLEQVEKQLQYFMTSPSSCMKSINEIECRETILKEAMKRVSLRKQVLEEKVDSEIASKTLHPQTATASRFMMGSPNYGLGWPQQQDHTQFLTTNLANPTGFQSLRNESENFAELLPSSMAFHDTTGYVVGGNSDQLQSSVVFLSAGYLAGNAGRTTGMTAESSQVVSDAAEGSQGDSITPMIDLNLPFAV